MKKLIKTLAAMPLIVVIPIALAGTALAAWVAFVSVAAFSGSASSAAEAVPIEVSSLTATAAEGAGPIGGLTCSATLTGRQTFVIDVGNADVNYSGSDDGATKDDSCAVTMNVDIDDAYYLNGVLLVVDGVEYTSANMASAPFSIDPKRINAAASDFCRGTGSPGGTGLFVEMQLTISELNSSPSTSYDLTGSKLVTTPVAAPVPCVSAGL